MTSGGHPSKYCFPTSVPALASGKELLDSLNQSAGEAICIEKLHRYLYHFLAKQKEAPPSTKWASVLECFFAVLAMKEDGTFLRPTEVTQPLAAFKYHCRSAFIYEAHEQQGQFNNDPAW